MKPGFVYVLRMFRANNNVQAPPLLIKVGETGLGNLNHRRMELNTGNPYRLDYVARWRVTDTITGEQWAHGSLVGREARPLYGGGREWFMLPSEAEGGFNEARRLIEEALELSEVLHPDHGQNM